jgi:hypothetical protein
VDNVSTPQRERDYETTKRLYLAAVAIIAVGLAVAGSVDRAAGGVILLVGWIAGVMGLHRMGRAGSTPRD